MGSAPQRPVGSRRTKHEQHGSWAGPIASACPSRHQSVATHPLHGASPSYRPPMQAGLPTQLCRLPWPAHCVRANPSGVTAWTSVRQRAESLCMEWSCSRPRRGRRQRRGVHDAVAGTADQRTGVFAAGAAGAVPHRPQGARGDAAVDRPRPLRGGTGRAPQGRAAAFADRQWALVVYDPSRSQGHGTDVVIGVSAAGMTGAVALMVLLLTVTGRARRIEAAVAEAEAARRTAEARRQAAGRRPPHRRQGLLLRARRGRMQRPA